MNLKPYIIPALLTVSMFAAATVTFAQTMPEVMQQGNISYVSGGIGDGEKEALEAAKKDYTLHVLNAQASGAYVDGTQLVIKDHTGAEVLSSEAGPIFYANLPAGKYTVTATHKEETKTQTIRITSGKGANLHFAWKTSANEEN